MDKSDMSFECKWWSYFSSVCEIDGKECSGDAYETCPFYIDCNEVDLK